LIHTGFDQQLPLRQLDYATETATQTAKKTTDTFKNQVSRSFGFVDLML
jgi:hypothetical protein